MLRIENARFEHNRIIIKINDGREELRHLLNWPILFPVAVEYLNNHEIINDRIVWPLLKFELNLTQILRAKKR